MTEKNWAGNLTYRARQVEHPSDLAALQELVASSREVHALGSRHSFNDVADAATLVALDRMPVEVDVDADAGTVRVAGGVRYGTLAAHLHERGWALHTMASLPHIGVVGAVATATHGSGDRVQNLSAAVVGLELVTGDGGLLRLEDGDPDLPGAVVGLGALGVATAVTLRVEPTYDVAQEVHTGLPWDVVLADPAAVTGSADSVSLFTDWASDRVQQVWRKSRVVPGWEPREDLLGAPRSTVQVHPLPEVAATSTTEQLGVPGPWHERLPHFRMEFTPSHGEELQSEYLVDRAHLPGAVEALRRLGHRISPLLLVAEVRTIAADDLWLSSASGRHSVGLHFTWRQRTDDVLALLPVVEEALAPFDPRPHWGKLFTADVAGAPDALRAVYPRFEDFRGLAARLDPAGRFRTPFLRRHGLVD